MCVIVLEKSSPKIKESRLQWKKIFRESQSMILEISYPYFDTCFTNLRSTMSPCRLEHLITVTMGGSVTLITPALPGDNVQHFLLLSVFCVKPLLAYSNNYNEMSFFFFKFSARLNVNKLQLWYAQNYAIKIYINNNKKIRNKKIIIKIRRIRFIDLHLHSPMMQFSAQFSFYIWNKVRLYTLMLVKRDEQASNVFVSRNKDAFIII